MPNKSYAKGYRFERKVKAHLEAQGNFVIRQGKSKFPDLIVFSGRGFDVLFVECKWRKYLSRNEKEEAKKLLKFGDFRVAYPRRDGPRGKISYGPLSGTPSRRRLGLGICRKCGSEKERADLDVNSFCEACQK